MKHRLVFRGAWVAAASALLGACTTQPAVEQSGNTVKLMSLVNVQVREFRQVEGAAEAALLESLQAQRAFRAQLQVSADLDTRAARSAGDTLREGLRERMLADADAVAAGQAAFAAAKAADAQKFAKLLAPLPSPSDALTDAQAKAAEMGVELSLQTRLEELVAFGKEIKKNVDDNKEKIKKAQAAAAAAQTAASAAQGAASAAVAKDNLTLSSR